MFNLPASLLINSMGTVQQCGVLGQNHSAMTSKILVLHPIALQLGTPVACKEGHLEMYPFSRARRRIVISPSRSPARLPAAGQLLLGARTDSEELSFADASSISNDSTDIAQASLVFTTELQSRPKTGTQKAAYDIYISIDAQLLPNEMARVIGNINLPIPESACSPKKHCQAQPLECKCTCEGQAAADACEAFDRSCLIDGRAVGLQFPNKP